MFDRAFAVFLGPAFGLPILLLAGCFIVFVQTQTKLPDAQITEGEEASSSENTERVYIPLVQEIDVTLPGDLGRVNIEIALAIDASKAAELGSNLGEESGLAQIRLAEAALRLAEETQLTVTDLAFYRTSLPEVLRSSLNLQLSEMGLPEAVLEVLITNWRQTPTY